MINGKPASTQQLFLGALTMDLGYVYDEVIPCVHGEQYVKDFEIFALDNRGGTFELQQLVTKDSIQSYITTAARLEDEGTTQILISRHKDHTRREIRPSFPPYSATLVKLLEDCWSIPSTYMQLRTYANACGTLQRYVRRDQPGSVRNLSFILRVPHSPRLVKSIWSLAVCWEPRLSRTFALFDGASDLDVRHLQRYLNARPQLPSHPLTLPTIITDILSKYKIATRNRYERLLWETELDLGITRGSTLLSIEAGQRLSHELDEITSRCHQLTTSIVYLERSQIFIRDLTESLRRELGVEYTFDQQTFDHACPKFAIAAHQIRDIVDNCHNVATNTIHQVSCLEKRTKMLLDVIYILIAQKDNRLSIDIAIAAKRDSSIVTAIGVVTMIFLPATFVTSLFGMNFFNFDVQAQSFAVSNAFWLYWAITLPLTMIVLLMFLCWMIWSRSSGRQSHVASQRNNFAPGSSAYHNPRADLLAGLTPLPESIGPCYPPTSPK